MYTLRIRHPSCFMYERHSKHVPDVPKQFYCLCLSIGDSTLMYP